jgi:uncharacterized protein YlxW (UPF0749 family)
MSLSHDNATRNKVNQIDTERGVITFNAPNLLDNQIMQEVKQLLENNKLNDLRILESLQQMNKGERPLKLEKLNDEVEHLTDKIDDLEQESHEMEEELDGLKEKLAPVTDWGLLGEQINEAYMSVLSHQNTNQIHFCNHLQKLSLTGYKN